jgi:ABC-type dipeptide/oligopeptide/nickel transport system ATPase component
MIDTDFIVPKKKKIPKKLADDPLGTPSISMIVGGVGSGKSTNLMNIMKALQDRHDFDSGLFVTSNNRDPLLQAVELDITTSPNELENYITQLKQSKEGQNHILVLDDIQGSRDFNIMSGRSNFINFILSHRHYGEDPKLPDKNGSWILVTAQTLKNSFSPVFRDQVRNWFLYYPRKPTDVKLYEDLAVDPTAMRRAMNIVKNEGKHAFLYLNKQDPEKDRYFLGYKDELKDLD